MVASGWRAGVGEKWGVTANGDGVPLGGDEYVPQSTVAMVFCTIP